MSLSGANCRSLLLADHAIGQWRRWLECVVRQQYGHIEHLMFKLQNVTVTLDNK